MAGLFGIGVKSGAEDAAVQDAARGGFRWRGRRMRVESGNQSEAKEKAESRNSNYGTYRMDATTGGERAEGIWME
jgi:hypothetical protein